MSRHLVSVHDLGSDGIERVLDRADQFAEVMDREIKKVPSLRGRVVVNLFLEPSTRTSTSFEIAGKRLSADVISVRGSASSVEKGESLRDTVLTLDTYAPDVIVIRHKAAGAAALAARVSNAAIVNAGDGTNEHPTQALLDLYTVRQLFDTISGLQVAFVGDVLHSRVARSSMLALEMLGAHVMAVGPPTLLPVQGEAALGAPMSTDINDIKDADLVYVLRMQHERQSPGGYVPSLREYAREYGVNHSRLRPGQRVMHAGPVNRGVEISNALVDDPETLVLQQAANGQLVRMAVLYDLLAAKESTEAEPSVREAVAR
jgi:aspartate carbamoyltransferase catalytic subunit